MLTADQLELWMMESAANKSCWICGGALLGDYDETVDPELCETHFWGRSGRLNELLEERG